MNITLPIGNFSSTSSFISDISMPRRLSWNRYIYLLSFFTSYVYIFFIWFNVFHFISIFFTFRILEVENDLKEFTVLENATFIPISAKIGTNLNILKEKLISIVIDHKKRENEKNIINDEKMSKNRGDNNNGTDSDNSNEMESNNDNRDSHHINSSSNGVLIDIVKSRKLGNTLHTVIREGQVKRK